MAGIDNSKIIKKTESSTQYLIKDINGKLNYYLTIDKVNSKLIKINNTHDRIPKT